MIFCVNVLCVTLHGFKYSCFKYLPSMFKHLSHLEKSIYRSVGITSADWGKDLTTKWQSEQVLKLFIVNYKQSLSQTHTHDLLGEPYLLVKPSEMEGTSCVQSKCLINLMKFLWVQTTMYICQNCIIVYNHMSFRPQRPYFYILCGQACGCTTTVTCHWDLVLVAKATFCR